MTTQEETDLSALDGAGKERQLHDEDSAWSSCGSTLTEGLVEKPGSMVSGVVSDWSSTPKFSAPGVQLYLVRLSAPCRIIWLYLLQNEIPHTLIDVELENAKDAPDIFTRFPHKEVPLLVDGSVIVFEAPAILQYLGMQYTSQSGFGLTVPDRMLVNSLLSWANSDLHRVTGYMYAYPSFLERYKLPQESANETLVQTGLRELSKHLERIELGYLQKFKYLTGDKITVADSFVATVLLQAEWAGFKFNMWPNVKSWLQRVETQVYWTRVHATHCRLVYDLDNTPLDV